MRTVPGASRLCRANAADLGALSRLFSAAFLHDPIFDWIARPGRRRATALERFFHATLETHAIPLGAAWIGDGVGAVFFPPAECRPQSGLGEYFRLLLLFARLCGVMRLGRGLEFGEAVEEYRPRQPHYYLAFFAVAPRLQGQGLGGALLEMLLKEADAQAMPVYLENSNPCNRAFYARHGFVFRRNIAPRGAPPVAAMWRAGRLL
jgi:GNAT superfamily N-acetyltransferase